MLSHACYRRLYSNCEMYNNNKSTEHLIYVMLDSLSKWSIALYGETSNPIWLFFLWNGIYMVVSFYDNLTNTLEYPHFLKNIKPHESEYLIKHIY
jgi:hypothetical protein